LFFLVASKGSLDGIDIVLVKVSWRRLEMMVVELVFLGEVGIRYCPVISIDTDPSSGCLHLQIREIFYSWCCFCLEVAGQAELTGDPIVNKGLE